MDLLPEDELHVVGIGLGGGVGVKGVVEGEELFGGEGADVIEVFYDMSVGGQIEGDRESL